MTPSQIFRSCKIGHRPLYSIGTFSSGVTVLSQQIRALNLAWAFVEARLIDCVIPNRRASKPQRIAVVGGGFAGLTFAAGLLAKQANAEITIFEERDTLLPLQHGSDSRWLHPQIYNWPGQRSEMNVAMLPVLNWSAARASDVVVQIMTEWKASINRAPSQVRLYCNARHLQVREISGNKLVVEWVGERRDPRDATMAEDAQIHAVGASESFDHVVLAIGFGLEQDDAVSYWRNEQLGQPSLDQPRKTFLVSGQGDGAMIDLLRLRISHYRPDRILDELFSSRPTLLSAVEGLYHRNIAARRPSSLFAAFESLSEQEGPVGVEFRAICDELRKRLRRDTSVILHMRQQGFAAVFGPGTSFQNRFLVYLLFKCGGFVPTNIEANQIVKQNALTRDCIVTRHGTNREAQFTRVLSGALLTKFKRRYKSKAFSLPDGIAWRGGYFGYVGPRAGASRLPDGLKKNWRKEYLPSPTALLATALCSSIAGYLNGKHPADKRLRVTLHRAMQIGAEEVLQQACDYQGISILPESTSGRTFPARNATIGLAYQCRQVVRSRRRVNRRLLESTMSKLRLNDASSKMAKEVGFVLAIPLLEPERAYTLPQPVIGIIYIDSDASGFFVDDDGLATLLAIAQRFLDGLSRSSSADDLGRVRNFRLSGIGYKRTAAKSLPGAAARSLELVNVAPPATTSPFQLNFDYSDFVPTQIRSII
jgi:hypothetical protein